MRSRHHSLTKSITIRGIASRHIIDAVMRHAWCVRGTWCVVYGVVAAKLLVPLVSTATVTATVTAVDCCWWSSPVAVGSLGGRSSCHRHFLGQCHFPSIPLIFSVILSHHVA